MSAILLAVDQQRIGSIIPPTHGAGLDPAYIPGLVPARPVEAEEGDEAAPEQVTDGTAAEEAPEEPAAVEAPEDSEDSDAEPEDEDDGPVFEVSDRRASVVADRAGITFRLDEEVAEFGWDEIGAVEIDTPRFGRRFGVTVYTSSQRWFQAEVDATSRAELKTWAAELDAVLDVRFEDPEE